MLICRACLMQEDGVEGFGINRSMLKNYHVINNLEGLSCGRCSDGGDTYLFAPKQPRLPQPSTMRPEDLIPMASDRLRVEQRYVEVPDYAKASGTADFNLKTPFGQPLQAHFNHLINLAVNEGKDAKEVLKGAEALAATINEEFLGKPLVEVMLACVLHLLQIEKIAEVASLGGMTFDEAHEVLRRRMGSLDRGNFGRG